MATLHCERHGAMACLCREKVVHPHEVCCADGDAFLQHVMVTILVLNLRQGGAGWHEPKYVTHPADLRARLKQPDKPCALHWILDGVLQCSFDQHACTTITQ